MNLKLEKNWTTDNNNFPVFDDEIKRYISVVPSDIQLEHSKNPFYLFVHFGMNTATGREWGNGTETVSDFDIKKVKPEQWCKTAVKAKASGIILTCKHHDGFCLWDTKQTDFKVSNTNYSLDIVKQVSEECKKNNLKFGIYLSPWDMHEKTYGTPQYDEYFCSQLVELLTNYGDIFEVWFDGAKGASAKSFEYNWEKYYQIIRSLQPNANIAICGPDIRWVGNEGGHARKNEYSVVPAALSNCEKISDISQHDVNNSKDLKRLDSKDKDLGSRKILEKNAYLAWYPAEVDVSIRKDWFWNNKLFPGIKTSNKLLNIYINSVGNNCYLLLNVPPNKKGVFSSRETRAMINLGKKIDGIDNNPIIEQSFGKLDDETGYLTFDFGTEKKVKYCVIEEDIQHSQRIESFDLYLKKSNGKYKYAYNGTIVGNKKIIKIKGSKYTGAILVIRQTRSNPYIKKIGFYQ